MHVKAVIFDLDGTLLNTLTDIAEAANKVLAERRLPTHAIDDYRYFVGDGTRILMERILPPECRTTQWIDECLAAFQSVYETCWQRTTRPYPGVARMLSGLRERGLRLAVLSNKPHDFTKKCVGTFLEAWPFDWIAGMRPGIPRKPDPAGVFEIMRHFDLPAEDFLYVGDTAIDMHTATAACLFPVGVRWGFRPADELLAAGAKVLIAEPPELLNLLPPAASP